MPRVGEAYYELTARDEKLLHSLSTAEGQIEKTGTSAERAFSTKTTGAMDATGAAGGRLSGVMGKLHVDTSKFGGVMSNLGTGVLQGVGIAGFMGVTMAAGALVGGVGHAIDAASNLNETVSKVGVVFGPAAASIDEWGKTAATSMGMSRQAAEEAAGTFGNLFVALKLPQEVIPSMSMSLVKLAGDLASFNNVSPEEALEALRSGLVGETEPLRKFGVNLSEATLSQEAMRLGLVKTTTGVLPAAIRTQAAYSLIMQQTSTAQGDFARTSDGLANTQRIAAAKVEDSFARIGNALQPLAARILPLLANAFAAVAEVLGTLFDALGDFIAQNETLFSVLGAIAGFILTVVGGAFGALGTIVGAALKVVGDAIGFIVETVKGVLRDVTGLLASFPNPLQDWAKSVHASLVEVHEFAGREADDTVKTVAATTAAGAPVVAAGADVGLTQPVQKAASAGRKAAVHEAAMTPADMAKSLAEGRSDVSGAMNAIRDVMKNTMTKAKEETALQAFLSSKLLAKALNDSRPEVRAAAEAQKQAAEDRLFALQHNVAGIALKTGQSYAEALKSTKSRVKGAAEAQRDAAENTYIAFSKSARSWGANTGIAYAGGLVSTADRIRQAAATALAGAKRILAASSPPGPESPLHDVDKWGYRTMVAYGDGIEGAAQPILSSTKAALSLAAGALTGLQLPGLGSAPGLQGNLGLQQAATVRTSFGALGSAAAVSGGSSVAVGDVHVHVNVDELRADDKAQITDLARQLANEVRLSLVRTPITFTPGG